MEFGVDLDQIAVDLWLCDYVKWHGISMRIHVTFFTGMKWRGRDPVKNMKSILLEIPFHLTSQIDGSLVQIQTKFHDYSMTIIQVLLVFHAEIWHGFCISSSHGISMAFSKKMSRISIGFGLILDQTAVKKTRKNIKCHIFYRDY